MPIISKVEGQSTRGRLIYAAILSFLTLGGVTMVYPFVIMVSGTVRSEMDETDLDMVPEYMVNDHVLYQKFLETNYNQGVEFLNRSQGSLRFSFKDKELTPPTQSSMRGGEVLRQFLNEHENWPRFWDVVGSSRGVKTVPENVRELTQRLRERYGGDLNAISRDLGVAMVAWDFRGFVPPEWIKTGYDYELNSLYEEFFASEDETDWAARQIMSVSGYFTETMIVPTYGRADVAKYNEAHQVKIDRLERYVLPPRVPGEDQPKLRSEWTEFVTKELNPSFVALDGVEDADYQTFLQEKYGDAASLNRSWASQYDSIEQVKLPRKHWLSGARRTDYVAFLSDQPVDRYTIIAPEYEWRRWLSEQYPSIDALNREWHVELSSFDDIGYRVADHLFGQELKDQIAFAAAYAETNKEAVVDPVARNQAWRQWLKEKYGNVNAVNAAWINRFASFDQAPLPVDQLAWAYVQSHAGELRWTFAVRNYINVFDALFIRGRAFLNTTIFCLLSIMTALLINPLAAYAMSRFQLPGTYKFLLILMATMSFPPMVTMIPTFIMLRELDMLNSFWALVLPAAANGYMIFLLKGFFDSLPQDLYEAALIDGAGEFRMFFQITMALSKPILAVVALGAFTAAYTQFLYALVVCPDEDMWLLNVYLFQYQQQVSMGGMFAAVLVAAIPPLVIFLFAQNVIMRGIVVPVEK